MAGAELRHADERGSHILQAIDRGNPEAAEQLLPLI
jgi:hypothetical protein